MARIKKSSRDGGRSGIKAGQSADRFLIHSRVETPAPVCLAPKSGACERDVARGRLACAGCRRGLRLQNATALRACVPSNVWSQPNGISARISALEGEREKALTLPHVPAQVAANAHSGQNNP